MWNKLTIYWWKLVTKSPVLSTILICSLIASGVIYGIWFCVGIYDKPLSNSIAGILSAFWVWMIIQFIDSLKKEKKHV